MSNAHLAHLPHDVHGRGLALAFEELYRSQDGRPSGNLHNPKKGHSGIVAVVTREGAWRVTHPGWLQGQLPSLVIQKACQHIEALGGKPSKEKLEIAIQQSTELANAPENKHKRQRRARNAKSGAKRRSSAKRRR